MSYNEHSTIELRNLAKRQHPALVGTTWRGIYKPDLVELLEGRTTAEALLAKAGRPAPIQTAAPQPDSLADAIAAALAGRVQGAIDADAVQAMIDASIEDVMANLQPGQPAVNAVVLPELGSDPRPVPGLAHRQFMQVLTWCRADIPIWLWGAPGAGKTHLARQIAAALGLDAHVMSIDETTTANKLLGFQNLVSGEFVQGWLYKPYKDGGLVMIDEIDTGNPGILAGLNALLANAHYMFPNGETVERHPSFRVIAAANTNGTGAVAGFTIRNRLDAATLNRFAVIEMVYDEDLEMAIACGVPPAADRATWQPGPGVDAIECQEWVRWVSRVRERVGRSVLISPRASILGVRALMAGIPVAEVADALVYALCSADTKRSLREDLPLPTIAARKAA